MSETACGYTILPQRESTIGLCPVRVCALVPTPYAIFDSQKRALSREAAVAAAPRALVELLDLANEMGAEGNNPSIGIFDSTRACSTQDPFRPGFDVEPRGVWEIGCGVTGGQNAHLISPESADRGRAVTLSKVLHRLYGTSPSPEPEPPAPPTPQELAERAEAMRKRGVLRNLSRAIWPMLAVEVGEVKALAIIDAVREYNATAN
jgi:hypothetical protein